ncbi:hypothetical protein AB2B38_008540 [Balneola sp. MJW-20]|uniref:hypothetical protein n=1 Tax=Gracilimonas aurantiaca TaxID=3234185 RepID=UPI003466951A
MHRLKAGYYIPDFEAVLKEIAGNEYSEALSQMDTGFQITGLPNYASLETVHPVMKVLWNLLTRNSRLLAPKRLSDFVLKTHLGTKAVTDKEDGGYDIDLSSFKDLNHLNLKYILKNISKYTDDKVNEEFGADYTPLFNVLFDLRIAAQLQRALLQCMMLGEYKICVDGVNPKLADEIASGINDWVTCLNGLLHEEEERIPALELSYTESEESLTFYYTYDPDNALTLCTVLDYEGPEADKDSGKRFTNGIFTGRRIHYADLHSEEHHASLQFIRQNVFREEASAIDTGLMSRMLQTEDMLACLPNGKDTSRDWQLAAMLQPGISLVVDTDPVSMNATCNELQELEYERICCIPSSSKGGFIEKRIKELREGMYQILLVHPDLLLTETFGSAMKKGVEEPVAFTSVFLKDIHRVSEWGDEFRSDYLNAARKLSHLCRTKETPASLKGLTSSATHDILTDIYRELAIPESVLYVPSDLTKSGIEGKGSYRRTADAFTDVKKEKVMIRELLTEVRYDFRFFMDLVTEIVHKEFPVVAGLKLGKGRYLYAHGPVQRDKKDQVIMGLLDLKNQSLRNHDKVRRNFDPHRALEIMNYLRKIVMALGDPDDYAGWLQQKRGPGIGPLLHLVEDDSEQTMVIGLTNDIAGEITKKISAAGNNGFEEHMVYAAASASTYGESFVEELKTIYQHELILKGASHYELQLSEELTEDLKEKYYSIRTARDTQLALYRLRTAGIIDDHVTDHSTGSVTITFKRKPVKEYYMNLQLHIRQYFGRKSTAKWMELARKRDHEHFLIGIMDTLIEFADEEIAGRRVKAAGNGTAAIDSNTPQSPARVLSIFEDPEYLPGDLNSANKPVAEMVEKYLSFIQTPPDGSQSEMSTVRQLKDACVKLRAEQPKEHAALNILTAFSMFALDVEIGKLNGDARKRAVAEEAMDLYMKGMEGLQDRENWTGVSQLMKQVNEQIMDLNPVTEPLVEPMMTAILLKRTNKRLKEFLERTGISS